MAIQKIINIIVKGDGKGLQEIQEGLDKTSKSLENVSRTVGDLRDIGDVAQSLGINFKEFDQALNIVQKSTKGLAAAQQALNLIMAANPVGLVTLAVTGLVLWFNKLREAGNSVGESLLTISKYLSPIQLWLEFVGKIFPEIGKYIEEVRASLAGLIDEFTTFLSLSSEFSKTDKQFRENRKQSIEDRKNIKKQTEEQIKLQQDLNKQEQENWDKYNQNVQQRLDLEQQRLDQINAEQLAFRQLTDTVEEFGKQSERVLGPDGTLRKDLEGKAGEIDPKDTLIGQLLGAGVIQDTFQLISDELNLFFDAQQKRVEDQVAQAEEVIEYTNKQLEEQQNLINGIEEQLADARGKRREDLLAKLDLEKQKEQQLLQTQLNAENQKAKAAEQLQKVEENRQKLVAIGNALDKTALAIQLALSVANQGKTPFPANVVAIASTVAAIASALISIKNAATTFEDGGLLQGPSHAEGGIRGSGRFANVEVEGGEFIMNKQSTAKFLPLLKQMNANKFADGGVLPFADTQLSTIASQNSSNSLSLLNEIKLLRNSLGAPIYVAVTDINRGQERVAKIENFAQL